MYKFLNENDMLLTKQKCKRYSGTKDQLLADKMVIEEKVWEWPGLS